MTTVEVFSRIYAENVWGGSKGEHASGAGSRDPELVGPYVEAIRQRIGELYPSGQFTAVDLGCGDFAVGSQVFEPGMRYVACDVVPAVIERNRTRFTDPGIEFLTLDMITDPLPAGDLAFVRQVLQHLSNAQISAILPKLAAYSTVFISEHYPIAGQMAKPNLDKIHGGGTRVERASAVVLTEPPFNLPKQGLRLLLEVPIPPLAESHSPGVLRTYEFTPGAGLP